MGTQLSASNENLKSSAYGQIYVELQKTSYSPGDTLNGVIHINLIRPFSGKNLMLRLKGNETVILVDTVFTKKINPIKCVKGFRGNNIPSYTSKKEKQPIINLYSTIYSLSTLAPGQYSIPFSLLVPMDLPSTFFLRGKDCLADISYYIQAEFLPEDPTEPKLSCKKSIFIRGSASFPLSGAGLLTRKNVATYCICKGVVDFHAAIEKNTLTPGETSSILVGIDNTKTRLEITKIKCRLYEDIIIRANEKRISKTIKKVSIDLGSIHTGEVRSKLVRIQMPGHMKGNIKEYTQYEENTLAHILHESMFSNQLICPSTKGFLIESKHYIKVSCKMSKWCSNRLKIILPIVVTCDPVEDTHHNIHPLKWHPQVIENVNIALVQGFKREFNPHPGTLLDDRQIL